MIPASNVQNLMLKEETVEAAKAGKFHIYSARTIDEGIGRLTGVKAGAKGKDGEFEQDSVNAMVNKRFSEMTEKLAHYGGRVFEAKVKPRDD